jgi:hypothetical protein
VAGVSDRAEALTWVIRNQLGRRNLSPTEASYLRGKRYNAEKLDNIAKAKRANLARQSRGSSRGKITSSWRDPNVNLTAKKLGEELGVSSDVVRSEGKFAAAVDTIARNVGPQAALHGLRHFGQRSPSPMQTPRSC